MRKKLIVLIIILAIGAISFLVWAQNGDGTPLPPENYAPNFWFDSDENYFPTNPSDFYYENGDEITGERAVAKYDSLSLGEKLSKIKVFYTIKDQGGEWIYEYWVFYVLNAFENGHYGDWESVFVFVDKNSGKITKVNGSAHGSSNELTDLNNQNHIWNYVGRGSHANCPDEPADTQCKFLLWNWREQWDKNGPKIYYDQYTLKDFNSIFIQNFKGQKSFDKKKSPTLGINPFRILKLEKFGFSKPEKDIYLNFPIVGELFGRTPDHAWAQPEYDNPELIRPFTNVAVEKAQNFGQGIANGIKNNVQAAFSEIQFIFSQMNPFEAGVAQNIGQENQSGNIQNIKEESESNFETTEEDNLIALQDQLDDAAERMDILNQKAIDSVVLKNKQDLENKKENSENNKDLEKIEEENSEEIIEEDNQNDEEEAQDEEEDILKENVKAVTPKLEPKLCEKSVDNLPNRDKIVINELAWMGTDNSANNEWFELKNISGEAVDLNGWQVMDKDKQIKIVFSEQTIIPAHGFFLFERTDDGAVSGISADFIYQGGLNNTDEALFIFDASCRLADEVSAGSTWLAGDNVAKRTMERKADLSWQTSANINGTPKQENSNGFIASIAPIAGGTGSDAAQITVSPQILITEIQIDGENNEKEDFVELYNPNTESVDLTDWYIQRKTENADSFSSYVSKNLFSGKTINGYDYFLIANGSSSFSGQIFTTYPLTENNSLILKNPSGEIVDKAGWGTAQEYETATASNPQAGKSIGRKWSTTTQNYTGTASSAYIDTDNNQNDFEIQTPTPGSQNQSPAPQTPENQLPEAVFVFSPENPIINQEIIFNAASSTDADGVIALYIWDFGDNISSTTTEATTTHSYSISGDFIANLQVVDDQFATSSFATNTVSISQEEPTMSVVINEIAWMGTNSQNSTDEWIELYNNTGENIDLIGWTLTWSHGTTTRSLTFSTSTGATTTISANGFFLLERTDDDAVSDISADWSGPFSSGGLSNSGEKLELRNGNNTLIDLVDASSSWFAGTTTLAYISMERIASNASGSDPANWANNNLITRNGTAANGANINGTPASQNSVSKTETNVASLPFDEFDEITLTRLGNPYTIQNTLEVPQNKKLIVEPTVTLKFYIPNSYGPNDGAYLKVDGALEAIGAEGQEILFTSTGNLWPGIVFNAAVAETATSSIMHYVKIEKARSWEANIYSAVKITNKAVSIQNSTFDAYSNMRGLYLINSSSSIINNNFNNFTGSVNNSTGEQESAVFIDTGAPTIQNNTFTNNYNGIVVSTKETCLQNSNFKISGNNFSQTVMPVYITDTGFPCFEQNQIANSVADNFGVVFSGMVYKGVGMDQDNLWQSDSPIILETGFSLQNATLTVASGATIKFKYSSNVSPNTFLKIENNSRLLTQGTADNLVTFTSSKETPAAGNWQAIWFANGSFGELNFTRIKYGGFGSGSFRNECLLIESVDVVLNNTEKEFCEPY